MSSVLSVQEQWSWSQPGRNSAARCLSKHQRLQHQGDWLQEGPVDGESVPVLSSECRGCVCHDVTRLDIQAVSANVEKAKDKADALKYQGTLNKKRCFTLLVIANQNVDW